MATITDIRLGLKANLDALPGWQVSAYALANPTPPAIQILPGEVLYDQAFHRGVDQVTMLVQAFVALASDIGTQTRLDQLLDPTGANSLKTAVEANPTLGGLVDYVRVANATGYHIAQGANGPVLVCDWSVEVMAHN